MLLRRPASVNLAAHMCKLLQCALCTLQMANLQDAMNELRQSMEVSAADFESQRKITEAEAEARAAADRALLQVELLVNPVSAQSMHLSLSTPHSHSGVWLNLSAASQLYLQKQSWHVLAAVSVTLLASGTCCLLFSDQHVCHRASPQHAPCLSC